MESWQTQLWQVSPAEPGLKQHPGIREAAAWLRKGYPIAFPTETVYGLGADATSPEAVRRVFAAKGRPGDNPLIVHFHSPREVPEWVADFPPAAQKLADAFWPGPLTLVLPAPTGRIAPEVTAGLDSVAVRVPSHPVARALIAATGKPLAAPSANLSGRPSPTTAAHVLEDLGGRIPGVVDGGPTRVGVESTVLDLCGGQVTLLRPGSISRQELEQLLGQPLQVDPALEGEVAQPRSPGMKYRHYAPRGRMLLVEGPPEGVRRHILEQAQAGLQQGEKVGILTTAEGEQVYHRLAPAEQVLVLPCGSSRSPETVAQNLYACLRRFDQWGATLIYAEAISAAGVGEAVMNRLHKACGGRIQIEG